VRTANELVLGGAHDDRSAKQADIGGQRGVLAATLVAGGGASEEQAATRCVIGGARLVISANDVARGGALFVLTANLALRGGSVVLLGGSEARRPATRAMKRRLHRKSAATLPASGTPTIAVAPFLLTETAMSPALTRTPTMSARLAAQMPSPSNTSARRSVTA